MSKTGVASFSNTPTQKVRLALSLCCIVMFHHASYNGGGHDEALLVRNAPLRISSCSFLTSCTGISAYAIALRSTSHVGLYPWPFFHCSNPHWMASSTFKGLFSKHIFLIPSGSPSPSRTARPLPAATLLTNVLNIMSHFWSPVTNERTNTALHKPSFKKTKTMERFVIICP